MGPTATEVERLIQGARLHLAQGGYHDAAGRATEAIRLDGKAVAAYLLRAEAHRRLRKPDQALADLAVAIRLDPHRPGPYVVRAEILRRRNVLDQAIADATYALTLDPRNAAAYSIRAQCRHAIGDREGAAEDVQEMLQIDPTRPVPSLQDRGEDMGPGAGSAGGDRSCRVSGSARRADDPTLFADGRPVDKTYRSRPVLDDDEAPEALGAASGYKPEVVARPIPRARGRSRRSTGTGGSVRILSVGVAIVAACSLWMAFRGDAVPEPDPRPADPEPPHVARVRAGTEGSLADAIAPGRPASGDEIAPSSIRPAPSNIAEASADSSPPESTDETLSMLRGTWLAFTEVAGGRRIGREEMLPKRKTLKVVDDAFELSTTYYKIVGRVRPVPRDGANAIDLEGRYVVGGDGKDVMLRGIFEIDGDTLSLCYSYSDDSQVNERPTGFEAHAGRNGLCVFFDRVDP